MRAPRRSSTGPTAFPVTHSVLAVSGLVHGLLSDYDVGPISDCRLLQHNQNDTYVVQTRENRYVLRIYQARSSYTPRRLADVQYELRLLLHLEERGVPVSAPVARRDGTYLRLLRAPEGTRAAALFTDAPGEPVPPHTWDETFAEQFGLAMGTLHAAAADFQCGYRRLGLDAAYLIDRPLRLARHLLAHRPADWVFLRTLARSLKRRIRVLAGQRLSRGVCHGDLLGKTNMHRMRDGTLTFFDFETCGPGWRAYDIAVFRWALAQLTATAEAERLLGAFLDGYRQRCPLSPADVAAIPLFVAVRQLWFLGLRTGNWENWGQGEVSDAAFNELFAFWRMWPGATEQERRRTRRQP